MAILSDLIRNKTLKLLLINFLSPKVDVSFHFLSRSHCVCNSTHGKAMHSTTAPTSTDCGSYMHASILLINIEIQK